MTPATAFDYANAMRGLLPVGRAWPDDPASVQSQILLALAQTPARIDAAACELLAGSLPGSYPDLIPEWEETLGLPDPTLGANPTLAQRGASVLAHFIGGGGQSVPYFVAFAAALGFQISINEFVSFRPDISTVETPIYSDAWSFAWGVSVISNSSGLRPSVLIAQFEQMAPANTTVFLD